MRFVAVAGFFVLMITFHADIVLAQKPGAPYDAGARCNRVGESKCYEGSSCFDGWGLECFIDGRNNLIIPGLALGYQKEKCFGVHDISICAPCRNTFSIAGKTVSCEQFYKEINDYNEACGGCLREVSDGGG